MDRSLPKANPPPSWSRPMSSRLSWASRMLEIRNVVAKYGAATALWDVSLDVAAGELVCVVGPNGAGKTTLINVIAGLNRIAAGSLVVDGRDLSKIPAHRFCAAGIAIVPEGRRL